MTVGCTKGDILRTYDRTALWLVFGHVSLIHLMLLSKRSYCTEGDMYCIWKDSVQYHTVVTSRVCCFQWIAPVDYWGTPIEDYLQYDRIQYRNRFEWGIAFWHLAGRVFYDVLWNFKLLQHFVLMFFTFYCKRHYCIRHRRQWLSCASAFRNGVLGNTGCCRSQLLRFRCKKGNASY